MLICCQDSFTVLALFCMVLVLTPRGLRCQNVSNLDQFVFDEYGKIK